MLFRSDEPFGALDQQTRMHLGGELIRIWEKTQKTILFVTHDINEAVYLSDRVIVMTHRPSTVKEIVAIDLPRPRGPETLSHPQFYKLCAHLWELLRPESERDVVYGMDGSARKRLARILRWSLVIGFVIVLEVVAQKKLISTTMLTPPSMMATRLIQLGYQGKITANFVRTMTEAIASFALAASVGIGLGILFWKLPRIGKLLEPYIVSAYAVPFLLFYPVMLVLFGLGSVPIIVLAATGSMVSIILNTWVGFREIKEVYMKVGRNMNCSKSQMFRKIYFPAATPYIFAGLKLGFVYCLIGTIAMEFILAEKGLGFAVHYAYESFETPTMYAYILLIILIAVTCNAILFRGEREIAGSGR